MGNPTWPALPDNYTKRIVSHEHVQEVHMRNWQMSSSVATSEAAVTAAAQQSRTLDLQGGRRATVQSGRV